MESQPGQGTTLAVFLPVTAPEKAPEAPSPEAAIRGGTETILVIDDEDEIRHFLTSLLQLYGYTVVLGTDGREGWAVFQKERDNIDLVLLDLVMPHLSGEEVLANIRELDPETRVIVSTGVLPEEAEAIGATAVLHKPYRVDRVLRTVRAVLDA